MVSAHTPAGVPLGQVMQFALESLPLAAVAHSYHVDALLDPLLQQDPRYQMYSLIELNELHHQVSVLGSLLRMQMGDPTAAESLGRNLAGFIQNRQAALQVAGTLRPQVLAHPLTRTVLALTEQSNRQVASYWPVLAQTIAATGAAGPGSLLVGRV